MKYQIIKEVSGDGTTWWHAKDNSGGIPFTWTQGGADVCEQLLRSILATQKEVVKEIEL